MVLNHSLMKTIGIAIVTLSLFFSGCMEKDSGMKQLEVIDFVDLSRYVGGWYEIARYRNKFQEGCVGSKATYTLSDDGKIKVINECYNNSFSGEIRRAEGKAWVVDKETNSKLKVSFFWPFSGDYWIIDIGKDYEYSVVGHPDRKYLWILSRSPSMDEKLYEAILKKLHKQEYDTEKLIKTNQDQGGNEL